VVRFATAAWVEALDVALRAEAAPSTGPLTIRSIVRGAPEGDLEYRVIVDGDGARAELGPGEATVGFSQDLATARAVSAGRLRAQEALITGRLELSGDAQALIDHGELLAWIGDRGATVAVVDR
jgi:hypothetical protein